MAPVEAAIFGHHIALLPYDEKHVSVRHEWMQEPDNRLKASAAAPSYEEEHDKWETWKDSGTRRVFVLADVEKLLDLSTRHNSCLLGEAQLHIAEVEGVKEAKIDLLLVEHGVRRRSLLSESLLLLLQYGASNLEVRRFVVQPGSTAKNRLLFAVRDENTPVTGETVASAPTQREPKRRGSVVNKVSEGLRQVRHSVSSAIRPKQKTDIIQRLTRHLEKRDTGDHWPNELDFEITETGRLQLELTPFAKSTLEKFTSHANFIRYKSMNPDGHLRVPFNTRVNGKSLTLIPYLKHHVPTCVELMQHHEMHTNFGVAPPSPKEEQQLQEAHLSSMNVYSFVVCAQEVPGDASCPVTLIGRAQVAVSTQDCQVRLGIAVSDLELRRTQLKETLLCLLAFIRTTLFCRRVFFPAGIPIKAGKGEDTLRQLLSTAKDDEGNEFLDVRTVAARDILNRLAGFVQVRAFDSKDVKYVEGSAV